MVTSVVTRIVPSKMGTEKKWCKVTVKRRRDSRPISLRGMYVRADQGFWNGPLHTSQDLFMHRISLAMIPLFTERFHSSSVHRFENDVRTLYVTHHEEIEKKKYCQESS